jgi:hypothetical protein
MHAKATNRVRMTVIGLITLILAASCALALSVNDAGAVSATVLGKTAKTPKSPCDEKNPALCRIVVHVTTFQTIADGRGRIMQVPSNGHIVAWSTSLGSLPKDDIANADDNYGGSPVARLAVLKPKGKGKYKLVKQSPKVDLESRLGSNPIIALGKPLKVKKGQRIGITVPNWAPNFKDGLPNQDNQFIASREKGMCGEKDALKAKPQQKKGSTRNYGCRFNGSRMLYWAYFVPNKKK